MTLACVGGGCQSGSPLKPCVFHNSRLANVSEHLENPLHFNPHPKAMLCLAQFCVKHRLHVFLPTEFALTKCALVCHPNKSICRNICPALLTLTPKLAFRPRQMFGICPFPQNFPKSAQFSHLTGTMISRPRPLVQSTHGPRFWSNKVEDFFQTIIFCSKLVEWKVAIWCCECMFTLPLGKVINKCERRWNRALKPVLCWLNCSGEDGANLVCRFYEYEIFNNSVFCRFYAD